MNKYKRAKIPMRIFQAGMLLWGMLLPPILLAGCGRYAWDALRQTQGTGTEDRGEEEQGQSEQSGSERDGQEQGRETGSESAEDVSFARGSAVVEDEKAVYICGNDLIVRMDKESGEAEVLWQSDSYEESPSSYSAGNALLAEGRIYFMERYYEDADQTNAGPIYALATIRTDGTGYERLEEFAYPTALSLQGDILYADSYPTDWYNFQGAWKLREDGGLIKMQQTETVQIPDGYYRLDSIPTAWTVQECLADCGYCLLDKEGTVVRYDPETGEETAALPEGHELRGLYRDRVLSVKEQRLYLTDIRTLKSRLLVDGDADRKILEMDGEYLYTERPADRGIGCVYEKISLSDGAVTELFQEDMVPDYREWGMLQAPSELMPVAVRGEYLYHVSYRENRLYLMRRKLADPAVAEPVGECFYDRHVSEIGCLETHHEKLYRTEEKALLTEVYIERLEVDPKFPGADEINRVLLEAQAESMVTYAELRDMAREDFAQRNEAGGTWQLGYSLSDKVRITYSDTERYLSLCQEQYVDMGGPHGMPYRKGYTFDLTTGRRLALSDIIANDEEELRSIVTDAFAAYIGNTPGFWEDAPERVRESVSFDMDFYLTEEGICFYYEPYALGGFVLGFTEVVIPYEEWEMQIPIGESSGGRGPVKTERLDYLSLESRMTREEWEGFEQYLPVLREGAAFEMTNESEENFDMDGWAAYYEAGDIEEISVSDLDGDGIQELILLWTPYGDYLILHREDETFYGFYTVFRAFESLRTNGIFVGSGGALSNGWYRMRFEQGDWEEEELARQEGEKYWIGEEEVEEDVFEEQIRAWWQAGTVKGYEP